MLILVPTYYTGNHKRNLPRFCEDLVVVFSALPEVGSVSEKNYQQTHQIWEGFFSDSLYNMDHDQPSPIGDSAMTAPTSKCLIDKIITFLSISTERLASVARNGNPVGAHAVGGRGIKRRRARCATLTLVLAKEGREGGIRAVQDPIRHKMRQRSIQR